MTAIDEIKARVDIIDLVSETVQLRKTGKNYIGFCPFHPNSRTPAFVVFPENGTWRCFGACNEGGDIFKFMMKKEGWDFRQALRQLAERAGVTLEPLTPQRQAEDEANERLVGILEEAVTFFRFHLTAPAGKPALDYLLKRGISKESIETFGLGYAPDSWDAALNHLTRKQYSPADLAEVGLVSERESGGYYDRFRNRIMIPIRDAAGKMAGFGARILNPEDQPKFLNSPQTVLFDKGRLLYGLDKARKAIRTEDQAVIVEGYMDVIALHQAGFTNTVSPMGTALSEAQFRLLKNFSRRIVLALDPDAAGQRATLRGLEVAREALGDESDISFDARGLLRSEGRLQADLRVTAMPDERDPDEIALGEPDAWRAIVAEARPVVVHVMETLAQGQDLEDAKVKNQIAEQVLPLIDDIPSPIERDTYRQRLARLLRVDERVLTQMRPDRGAGMAGGRRRPRIAQPVEGEPSSSVVATSTQPALVMERVILELLLRDPEQVHPLNRFLQEAQVPRLDVQDFEATVHQILARLILDSLQQDEMEAFQFIAMNSSDEAERTLEEYAAPDILGEPSTETAFVQLYRTVLRLREWYVKRNLEQIRYMKLENEAETGGVGNMDDRIVADLAILRNRLTRALNRQVLSV